MELPKNVTQIGETDKFCKVYMEDYVVSYIKQMNRMAEDKQIGLALYGRCSKEEGVTYNFVYGAARMVYLQREVKHLSQAQNQEIERLQRKYFSGHEFIGYIILNGEMLEGVWLAEGAGYRFVKGYACFYEKNDFMLAYMLDSRAEESQPEVVNREKYDEVKKRQEERKTQYSEKEENTNRNKVGNDLEKRLRGMKYAAASVFVLLCLVSVVTLQSEGMNGKTGNKIRQFFASLSGDYEADDVEVMSGNVVNTLVAEEQLAEAIRKENELAAGTVTVTPTPTMAEPEPTGEPATTAEPMSTEVPMATETPEPISTPIPTPEPTPEPTEVIPTQADVTYETYTIKEGDTLLGISLKQYGSVKYVKAICELNNISDPDNIKMGQKILLP